jgi:hypothetical protein
VAISFFFFFFFFFSASSSDPPRVLQPFLSQVPTNQPRLRVCLFFRGFVDAPGTFWVDSAGLFHPHQPEEEEKEEVKEVKKKL